MRIEARIPKQRPKLLFWKKKKTYAPYLNARGWDGQSKLYKKETMHLFQIVYSQPNIRNMFFDKRFPQPPDVGVWGNMRIGGRGGQSKVFSRTTNIATL